MGWATAATVISALAAAGNMAINASKSNSQAQTQSNIASNALSSAESNAQQQAMIQALINKRSTAGYTDSAGSSLQYDPGSNTWVSKLGTLPQQTQTAADQASILRNTTDLRQAQAANEASAVRAARAAPYADTARRELETYRPMGQDALVGLLSKQATNANNATYRPLVADTLRSFARTGTAAGPVLAQLGKGSADSLRDSLLDAQLKGIQNTNSINESKRSGLASNAASAASLATPAFGYTSITPSSYSSTMANLANQRAAAAGTAPAYGATATNEAAKTTQGAYGTAIKNTVDPNYDATKTANTLSSLQTALGKGGAFSEAINALTKNTNPTKVAGSTTSTTPTSNYTFGGTPVVDDMFSYNG